LYRQVILSFSDYYQGGGMNEQVAEVFNPATGKVIRQFTYANHDEVEATIQIAKTAYESWSQFTPLKRARVLFKFKQLLEENINQIAELISEEHGKVVDDAKGEVNRAIELVEYMCGIPHLLKGSFSENVGTGVDSYTIRQPLGVCVGITPFNFPVMVPCWMFVSAIACGNAFVLKPSEKDPSSTLLVAKLFQDAGLPEGVLTFVHGVKEQVTQLITHPDVQAVSCVSSTPVAESIYKTAIEHGKRSHTFGGAKNHCIVMPDADLDDAASAIMGAAYGAAGERCMALSVVIAVTDAVADSLVEKLRQKIPLLKIAAGNEPDVDMGPLVTEAHLKNVLSYVELGIDEGAELVADGRKPPENVDGFFMRPCLFDHVTPAMKIYQAEIFGPVLCIVRQADFAQALTLINQHEYGNGTAIFTSSGEIAQQFATKVNVGMVGINVPIPVPVAYHAFGGWKRSIFGDTHMHGDESIRFYTKTKSVTTRWPKRDVEDTLSFHMPSH
jgi:malonate-semialdehyde dehydrogenase (acetylating)/methylmalonate-semialdehyde dehydrogenase